MTDRFWALFVRIVGGVLVLSFLVPAWRLLRGSQGIGAGAFVAAGPGFFVQGVVATVAVLVAGFILAPVVSGGVRRLSAEGPSWVDRRLAVYSGLAAGLASLTFSLAALGGGPFIVDGMSQLLQARLLTGGVLEVPGDVPIEFWYFQYLAPSTGGWASQYPIGYPALLAAGMAAGAPWLIGPICHGMTAGLGVIWLRRLAPGDVAVHRWGGLLLALSPFALALSGAFMNHGVAALFGLVAVMAADHASRAPAGPESGGVPGSDFRKGMVAGLSVGLIATMRPLTGLVTAVAAAVVWWARGPKPRIENLRFPMGACLGVLPPLIGLLWVNQRLFGGALTFGYTAAQGPNHGLGFHTDPWGVPYGPIEAIGYTGTELRALGAALLGVPVPALLMLGAVFLLVKVPARQMGPLVVWAILPAVAGIFYWHHDLAMGPRLLADSAPAWAILLAWGLTLGARAIRTENGWRSRYPGGVATALVLGGLGLGGLGLSGYRGPTPRLASGSPVPANSLVFVHDSWESRLSARLAAVGARDDQIRALRAAWSSCDLQVVLDVREDPGSETDGRFLERLLAEPAADGLIPRVMPSGSRIMSRPGEELSGACQQEAVSDFNGVAGLPQRLWLGDLPGHERGTPMYVRDLGPERNRALLGLWPERRPYVLVPTSPARLPDLLPYEEGMSRLWSAVDGSPGG